MKLLKRVMYEAVAFAKCGVIALVGMSLIFVVACAPSPGSKYYEPYIYETPTKITKYRLNHNKILYDVILHDGSRCVVSTGGGLYCEFVE